ncbi:MAG: prephenate dehydrogenase [Verrucomicrobiales bacterium]
MARPQFFRRGPRSRIPSAEKPSSFPEVPPLKRIAILGPGLLGGSIAMAVAQRAQAASVRVWARSEQRVHQINALGGGGAEISVDLGRVLEGAQLVVLAVPVGVMEALALRVVETGGLADGAVVVDVGSVKGVVEKTVAPVFAEAGIAFVSSHPMAGSEQTGWAHARADLFEGSVCVLTPSGNETAEAVECARVFWRSLGCELVQMGVAEHDRAVARISHLPHAAAAALVLAALAEDPSVARLCGNGFRDSSRVASGESGMWAEILLENRDEVVGTIDQLRNRLAEVRELLERGDREKIRRWLDEARNLRDASLRGGDWRGGE